jgi:hypothetical protein
MCSEYSLTVVTPCGLLAFINISFNIVLSLNKLNQMGMLLRGHSPVSMQLSLCPSVRKFHLRNYPDNLYQLGGWRLYR